MLRTNFESQFELKCKPIDSYKDLMLFLQHPPPWRSLCVDLKPHSNHKVRNMDINKQSQSTEIEFLQNFCHFEPEMENIERHRINKLPKTLVCHDMANGYHDDRLDLYTFSYVDGTGVHDAYTFYNWSGIDIFCYFSHHLVTIPPLGWINVGHAHGVKVIGTLITEWSEGEQFWEEVLASEAESTNLASMLVAIAKTLKFDGWLLNVENKVSAPRALLQFVRLLHAMLHQELRDPVLVWYDSVTIHGHLAWQNQLNHNNMDFFLACDGIFTNYAWSEREVRSSAARAQALPVDRRTDVYIGLDVWGRNFYGGGQFNTREALKIAHKYGCSVAIFAPAWTHEAVPDEATSCVDKYDQFLVRDRALWCTLWPYLTTSLPTALPFQTSFCRGQGKKRRHYGEVFGPVPWYNLRHMQYQPNSNHGQHGYILATIKEIVNVLERRKLHQGADRFNYRDAFHATRAGSDPSDNAVPLDDDPVAVDGAETRHDSATTESQSEDQQAEVGASGAGGSMNVCYSTVVPFTETGSLGSVLDVDPRLLAVAQVPDEPECLQVYLEDSFMGGSCLKVNPTYQTTSHRTLARLFHCDFHIQEALVACVVTKNLPGHEAQSLSVQLLVVNSRGQDSRVVLNGAPEAPEDSEPNCQIVDPTNVNQIEFKALQKYLVLNEPGFYVPTENAFGWNVRYYEVRLADSRVTSISCRLAARGEGAVLLGHVGLAQLPHH